MSEHLIPVKTGNEQIPVTYRNLGYTFSPYTSCCVEHDSMLYCFVKDNASGTSKMYRMNMFTGEAIPYATFTINELTNNLFTDIGQMLIDDKHMYLINNTSGNTQLSICIYSLRGGNEVFDGTTPLPCIYRYKFNTSINVNNTCYGKMAWYDDNTILIPTTYGFLLFDINTRDCTIKTRSTSCNCFDIAIGEKLIIMTNANQSNDTLLCYRKSDETFFTVQMPTTTASAICYEKGKFYVANTNYLYVFNENTETVVSTHNIPWANPYTICVYNDAVYVNEKGTSAAYIFDFNFNNYMKFYTQWSMPGSSYLHTQPVYPCMVDGFWFILKNTLCIVDYTGYSKYNFGYKYESISILFNQNELPHIISYDPRFVSFNETFMEIHDGDLNYQFTPHEEYEDVKTTTVHKSDYKFINTAKFS